MKGPCHFLGFLLSDCWHLYDAIHHPAPIRLEIVREPSLVNLVDLILYHFLAHFCKLVVIMIIGKFQGLCHVSHNVVDIGASKI